jgi:hypothetical protein
MGSIHASLARRGAREHTFRGLKRTAKISRRYRGEDCLQAASANLQSRIRRNETAKLQAQTGSLRVSSSGLSLNEERSEDLARVRSSSALAATDPGFDNLASVAW